MYMFSLFIHVMSGTLGVLFCDHFSHLAFGLDLRKGSYPCETGLDDGGGMLGFVVVLFSRLLPDPSGVRQRSSGSHLSPLSPAGSNDASSGGLPPSLPPYGSPSGKGCMSVLFSLESGSPIVSVFYLQYAAGRRIF